MKKKPRLIRPGLIAVLLVAVPFATRADPTVFTTKAVAVQAETIVSGLEHPWGLDFLPNGDIIATERPGRIRILSGTKLSDPVEGVPDVADRGQGGLLDIAVSPDFESSNLVFFSFSQPGPGGAGTAVARARLMRDGDNARLEGMQVIFTMAKKTGTTRHFGSRLVFSPDGTLFAPPATAAMASERRTWPTMPARSSE